MIVAWLPFTTVVLIYFTSKSDCDVYSTLGKELIIRRGEPDTVGLSGSQHRGTTKMGIGSRGKDYFTPKEPMFT